MCEAVKNGVPSGYLSGWSRIVVELSRSVSTSIADDDDDDDDDDEPSLTEATITTGALRVNEGAYYVLQDLVFCVWIPDTLYAVSTKSIGL